jgi:hypothetical protein
LIKISLPVAQAASSMSAMPWRFAISEKAGKSHGIPIWWITRMARVRGVMASSTRSGSILYVLGSISTKMGFAPQYRMLLAVAIKEWLAVITSSSVPTPTAISAK